MTDELARKSAGRPESIVPSLKLEITNVDPVTFRMLETLAAYGRFGQSRPQVALFIIRSWLMDKEAYLKSAITSRDAPLGYVPATGNQGENT